MSELVANCPRCGAKKITFDLLSHTLVGINHDWQNVSEAFCVCRSCRSSTVFILTQRDYGREEERRFKDLPNFSADVNLIASSEGYICIKNLASTKPPDHLPDNIEAVFREGAACLAIGCFNAAGTMFRLCLDLATHSMLPDNDCDNLNERTRRMLGLRLGWLFDNSRLSNDLRDLSSCIKDDGNDGAHRGTLSENDAQDILDFTFALLERVYTEPERVRLAGVRRAERRATEETE